MEEMIKVFKTYEGCLEKIVKENWQKAMRFSNKKRIPILISQNEYWNR